MMTVNRIKTYLDYKGISVAAFEKSIGMSNASFAKSLKNGGAIGSDKLERILDTYADLSAEWLLRGQGDMLRENNHTVTPQQWRRLEDDARLAAMLRRFILESDGNGAA